MKQRRYHERHHRRPRQKQRKSSPLGVVGTAAVFGLMAGVGYQTAESGALSTAIDKIAEMTDMRERRPQSGDYWLGCDAARAAGTHPIYAGEPGYRSGMDGDGDGIACEPYR